MASNIFFNGRVISVPGSYSEVDASGLEQIGLGAAGIVAAIGTAEGGKPVSAISTTKEFIRHTKPESVRSTFRSGDLREVGDMLFAPAKDPDILAGATEIVSMKVNPATQSVSTFSNGFGASLDVTSRDYGAFTEQINISIAPGTTLGKLLTIIFEDVTESVDDLGGDDIYKLSYDGSDADAWDTMTSEVEAGGNIKADSTRATGGLDSDIGTPLAAPGAIEVVSTAAGDTTQRVTVYGLDGSGNPTSETLTLNGTTPTVGTQVFGTADVLGAAIKGTIAGTVTVEPSGGGLAALTLAPAADPVSGLVRGKVMYVSGSKVTLVSDGASTKDVVLEGTSATGAVFLEKITLTGTTPVLSVGDFSSITAIVLGDVEAAQVLTESAEAVKTLQSVQNTILKVMDFFNARFISGTGGFIAELVTSQTGLDPDNLDVTTATADILAPANPGFKADLYAMIAWITDNSVLVEAARASGAVGGAPDDTASPVFLTGGSEGIATFADYQTALNLLKQTRVNSIVVLTGDPAVHAALDAHCAFMGGIGRSERDGFVGLLNPALTDVPSKDELKSQIVDLNTRHVRAWAQAVERFNTAGERTEFLPQFGAAILAGMQAGSSVGTSLTSKFMNILGFRQSSTWNPTDDAEELVNAGLVFCENVEGVGRRVVRNVTTHLSSNNIAFIEGSVNEATNFAVFNLRTNLEFAVGKKGFAGTETAVTGQALGTLGLLVDEEILTRFRSLDVELVADVMEVSVEIAPVVSINFVKTTVHLVTGAAAAA